MESTELIPFRPYNPLAPLGYFLHGVSQVIGAVPRAVGRAIPKLVNSLTHVRGGREIIPLIEILRILGDADPQNTLNCLSSRGLFTVEDLRRVKESEYPQLVSGLCPTGGQTLNILNRLFQYIQTPASLQHQFDEDYVDAQTRALDESWASRELTLEVMLDDDTIHKITVDRDILFDELIREIKSACRLSASQEARLLMVGLEITCQEKMYSPIQDHAEWNKILSSNPSVEKFQAYLPTPPINFDMIEYLISKSIAGGGGFGTVYSCMHKKTGFVFGAKVVMETAEHTMKAIFNEVNVMSSLHHENIVSYYGAQRVADSPTPHLRIFMEYCPGGSLKQLLSEFDRLPESLAQQFTYQMLRALQYLNSNFIVHRDLKPENVLFDTQSRLLKLCDFGISLRLLPDEQMSPRNCLLGTPAFLSPEVLSEGRYGHKSDIWALGCTVLAMLSGSHNFYDRMSSPMAIIYNVGQLKLKPNVPTWCSESTIDFLNQCFTSDWENRPDASDLLEHEFILHPITTCRSPPPGYYESAGPESTNIPALPLPEIGVSRSSINWTGSRDVLSAESIVAQDPQSTLTQITDILKTVPQTGFAPLKRQSASVRNTPQQTARTPPKFCSIRLPPLQTAISGLWGYYNGDEEKPSERVPFSMDSVFSYLASLGEKCLLQPCPIYASLFNGCAKAESHSVEVFESKQAASLNPPTSELRGGQILNSPMSEKSPLMRFGVSQQFPSITTTESFENDYFQSIIGKKKELDLNTSESNNRVFPNQLFSPKALSSLGVKNILLRTPLSK